MKGSSKYRDKCNSKYGRPSRRALRDMAKKSQATLPVSPEIRPLRALLQAAAACCLFICAACGMAEADEPALPPRIALITPAGAGELAEAIRLGAEAAAKERGAQLITVEAYPVDNPSHTSSNADFTIGPPFTNTAAAAGRDLTRSEREQAQVQAAALALEQGAAAILVDPLSEQALGDIVREAELSGTDGGIVPVIVLNDEFPVKGITSVISMDNLEAGRQAGQAMAELLQGRGQIALVGPDPTSAGLVNREQGIREALTSYPAIEIKPKSVCNNREDCWQAVKQQLDQPEVTGVVALQEQASLGAADELNRRRAEGRKVSIVGFGSEQQQLEQLQEGVFQRLIVQNGYSAGYLGINQALAKLEHRPVQRRVVLETKVVSTDNMFWMDNQKLLFPFVQ
ncbi:substrate-binding domain-containing protein [Paenibacillus silvae]|uniref:substrate-binding domain-containing protein n=1 Tax=Paenibacillus silvae TaxID=1325358 RepID=UPI0020066901|nr:substrate-binding domain-containing protein [Paenibacillus silvae]MCK6078556.1 substrate-binding domain-containing protein [Paenibacillus silvae]MCK6152876.1 substrate-binding domain-containing protein [Paenibacillus silvae]MCK6271328.1 substrate-binding domain-containing protein [Paenibacillus silvae]